MPKAAATVHGVLCDTSYFIRWAKPNEAMHPAAHAYLKFLVEGGHELYVSTIALAEYASGTPSRICRFATSAFYRSTSTMPSGPGSLPVQSLKLE